MPQHCCPLANRVEYIDREQIWVSITPKVPLPVGGSGPSPKHDSFCPYESTSQTVPSSIGSSVILPGSRSLTTDRQTDMCIEQRAVSYAMHSDPAQQCSSNAVYVHQSLLGLAPAYLADDCRFLSDVGRRPLRSNSNDMRKLLVPRTHNKIGDRSFSAAGPRLRRPGLTFDSFRQSLKTHLFGDRSA